MKHFFLTGFFALLGFLFLNLANATSTETTKLVDLKKVQVQFTKATVLKLNQFVRDSGRRKTENKNPNYRLLHESEKLTLELSGIKLSCTIYQKTMLSNRVKTYAEESVKFEKMITEKEPLVLSPDTVWTISRAAPNDLGVLLWLQAERRTLQIDCEKKNSDDKEMAMQPGDVLKVLSANDVKFIKDGKELQTIEDQSSESKIQIPSTSTNQPEATPESQSP